jgi:hypothetical protein
LATSPSPRYDRIVSLVALVVIGLGVVFLVDINPQNLRAYLGGDLPLITATWVLIASLVVITSAGADLFIRSHPQMQTRNLPSINLGFVELELAPGFWILPSFSIISSFAFFRLFGSSLGATAGILALVAAGALLFSSLVAQHYALDRRPEVSHNARLALQTITFLLAFGVFSAVYFTRFRTLYSAALIGSAAALLSYALLQWAPPRRGLVLLAGMVGLSVAEMTWALNYWAAPFLLGGALLLVIFYVATGILQNHLERTLTKRVFAEYGFVGVALLVSVVFFTFR